MDKSSDSNNTQEIKLLINNNFYNDYSSKKDKNIFISKYKLDQEKLFDEYQSCKMYSSEEFKEYIKTHYNLNNNMLVNTRIAGLIYTYEWFKYKNNYFKAIYHPYLKTKDFNNIDNYYQAYNNLINYISLLITLPFFLFLRGWTNKRYNVKNNPIIILSVYNSKTFFTIIFLFCLSNYGLKKHRDFKVNKYIEKNYKEYLNLDIDYEMLKKTLFDMNIIGNIYH